MSGEWAKELLECLVAGYWQVASGGSVLVDGYSPSRTPTVIPTQPAPTKVYD